MAEVAPAPGSGGGNRTFLLIIAGLAALFILGALVFAGIIFLPALLGGNANIAQVTLTPTRISIPPTPTRTALPSPTLVVVAQSSAVPTAPGAETAVPLEETATSIAITATPIFITATPPPGGGGGGGGGGVVAAPRTRPPTNCPNRVWAKTCFCSLAADFCFWASSCSCAACAPRNTDRSRRSSYPFDRNWSQG